MSDTNTTTDHNKIKEWVSSHDGVPAVVEGTEDGSGEGVLRIHFPNAGSDDNFKELSWDEFFKQFEDNQLALLYQEKDDSTFHKFVSRE